MTRAQTTSTTQQNTAGATPPNLAGKNAIINGGFDIWQRGTSFATSGSNYTADRWQSYVSSSGSPTFTFSRQTTSDTTNLPFIQYCMRMQRTSGQTFTNVFYLTQDFETVNSIPLAGKTVTLSFYARKGANFSAANDALSYSVITGTGTDQNNNSGSYTGAATPLSGTATLTTTWQRFQTSATLATTATELEIRFNWTPSGTAGAADYVEITGIQLEAGSVATPFNRNAGTLQGELAACQRYYWRATAGSIYQYFASGFAKSSTAATFTVINPVFMRVAPTSIDTSSLAVLNGSGSAISATSATLTYAGSQASGIDIGVASGLTAGQGSHITASNSTSAYIGFSAEL